MLFLFSVQLRNKYDDDDEEESIILTKQNAREAISKKRQQQAQPSNSNGSHTQPNLPFRSQIGTGFCL